MSTEVPEIPLKLEVSAEENGGYVATGSSSAGSPWWDAPVAFTKDWTNDNGFASAHGSFNADGTPADGFGSPTVTAGESINGSWVQLQLPTPAAISQYAIYPRNNPDEGRGQAPRSWYLVANNDGTDDSTWDVLDSRNDVTDWTLGEPNVSSFDNSTAYTFYRLVVTSIVGEADCVVIGELVLRY